MVSAYVPCYNNATTIRVAVESLKAQTVKPEEIFVVDDGSSDDSLRAVEAMGVRVIRHEGNLGRGAVRARAMNEASHEYVLCCDASNALHPDFTKNALLWFEDPTVAAVFGGITQRAAGSAVERWRGRHLFKLDHPAKILHRKKLATYGA